MFLFLYIEMEDRAKARLETAVNKNKCEKCFIVLSRGIMVKMNYEECTLDIYLEINLEIYVFSMK